MQTFGRGAARLALGLALAVPAAAQAQAPTPPSLCRSAPCPPDAREADRRLAAAWREAWAATSRPASLQARAALWQRNLEAPWPGYPPQPRVAPSANHLAEELSDRTRIDVALRAGASLPPPPLERTCFGRAFRRCEVRGSGALPAADGVPGFLWQTQVGMDPGNVFWGGVIVLARDGTRLRPVIWSFTRNDHAPPPPVMAPAPDGPMLVGALLPWGEWDDALVARWDRGAWRDVDAMSWFDAFRRSPSAPQPLWPRGRIQLPGLTVTMTNPPPWRRRGADLAYSLANPAELERSITVTLRREGDALVIENVAAHPVP